MLSRTKFFLYCLFLYLPLAACGSRSASPDENNIRERADAPEAPPLVVPSEQCVDGDGDGFGEGCEAGLDCDDNSAELGNECDEPCLDADGDTFGAHCAAGPDCNDANDSTWDAAEILTDTDRDGYGVGVPRLLCIGNEMPEGTTRAGGPLDCDDTNAAVSPGVAETPYNSVDDDCDFSSSDTDVDGDGYHGSAVGGSDCDDEDPNVYPFAVEIEGNIVDEDCNGIARDRDGDGQRATNDGGLDCDDDDPTTWTGAEEIYYDGRDNDCDATTVDNDQDGDGYALAVTETEGGDCDDENAAIYPGAPEVLANGIDEDCNGRDALTDNDGDGWYFEDGDCDDNDASAQLDGSGYYDEDGDGYGNVFYDGCLSAALAEALVEAAGDCDETQSNVNPGQSEVYYNGRDDDCDASTVDDDADADGWAMAEDCDDSDAGVYRNADIWADGDGDGWGAGSKLLRCIGEVAPFGFAEESGDCDDNEAKENPGLVEIPYNGYNDDCQLATRDDDLDDDGYLVSTGDDCDDNDPDINPGVRDDFVDGDDQNCDGVDGPADIDEDGHNSSSGDCNDNDPNIHPGALDTSTDDVDQNCDGVDGPYDADRDESHSISSGGEDCDDNNAHILPGGAEIADDGLDNDCENGDLRAAAGVGLYIDGEDPDCDDASSDSWDTPFCSIVAALAAASVGDALFVAAGTYSEFSISESLRLYGGYDSSDWSRDTKSQISMIQGASSNFSVDINAADLVVFDGFHVEGPSSPDNSKLFMGALRAYSGVALINNVLSGGDCDITCLGAHLYGYIELRGNVIESGQSSSGDSVAIETALGADGRIDENTIRAGVAAESSTAILNYGRVAITNNVIVAAEANAGNSVVIIAYGNGAIVNNTMIAALSQQGDSIGLVNAGTRGIGNNIIQLASAPEGVSSGLRVIANAAMKLFNNNFFGEGDFLFLDSDNGFEVSDLDILNACSWTACAGAEGNIDSNVSVDPRWVDEGGGDYRLQSNSPMIDAGIDVYEEFSGPVLYDRDGNERPGDKPDGSYGKFDMGAFEFVHLE